MEMVIPTDTKDFIRAYVSDIDFLDFEDALKLAEERDLEAARQLEADCT